MSGNTNNAAAKKKKSGKYIVVAIIAFILIIVIANSFFILYEDESAIVMRFGRIEGVYMREITDEVMVQLQARPENLSITEGTGLRFKIPFIDNVVRYTNRLIPYDSPPTEVLTRDRHRLFFDNTAVWRIINPVLFFESFNTIDRAKQRIDRKSVV
jgi:membrane protease subunit HflC